MTNTGKADILNPYIISVFNVSSNNFHVQHIPKIEEIVYNKVKTNILRVLQNIKSRGPDDLSFRNTKLERRAIIT